MEIPEDSFRKKIRDARIARKLKVREVADACGVSIQFVKDMEAGRRKAGAGTLRALAELFGVSMDDLLGASPVPHPIGPVFAPLAMSTVVETLTRIPDEIYELAKEFGPNDAVWKDVKKLLEIHRADKTTSRSERKA